MCPSGENAISPLRTGRDEGRAWARHSVERLWGPQQPGPGRAGRVPQVEPVVVDGSQDAAVRGERLSPQGAGGAGQRRDPGRPPWVGHVPQGRHVAEGDGGRSWIAVRRNNGRAGHDKTTSADVEEYGNDRAGRRAGQRAEGRQLAAAARAEGADPHGLCVVV
jgi:hypothetical protein